MTLIFDWFGQMLASWERSVTLKTKNKIDTTVSTGPAALFNKDEDKIRLLFSARRLDDTAHGKRCNRCATVGIAIGNPPQSNLD